MEFLRLFPNLFGFHSFGLQHRTFFCTFCASLLLVCWLHIAPFPPFACTYFLRFATVAFVSSPSNYFLWSAFLPLLSPSLPLPFPFPSFLDRTSPYRSPRGETERKREPKHLTEMLLGNASISQVKKKQKGCRLKSDHNLQPERLRTKPHTDLWRRSSSKMFLRHPSTGISALTFPPFVPRGL